MKIRIPQLCVLCAFVVSLTACELNADKKRPDPTLPQLNTPTNYHGHQGIPLTANR